MRWLAALLLPLSLGACATLGMESPNHRFPIFFAPESASLSHGADSVARAAASFAKRHPDAPIIVAGYSAPPGAHYVEAPGLDGQRADIVTQQLIADGVPAGRIVTKAMGVVQPEVPMSKIEMRRVDVVVGNPPQPVPLATP